MNLLGPRLGRGLFAVAAAVVLCAGAASCRTGGVKYPPCDPAKPVLPCTEAKAKLSDDANKSKKPMYVKCDPAQPNLPCTPDTPAPAPSN